MKLSTTIVALGLSLLQFSPALGRQFPTVNGVIGGVSNATSNVKAKHPNADATTPGKLRIKENTGICETTPGVYSASGYGDLTSSTSIFFWYFAARKNPDTAPVALWFNGGPGSSSMIGLFQELGPCRIRNDSSGVDLNPYSWNNNANILFIDQPVGAGFSHGTLNVGTSDQAASDIWKFLQIFFSDSRFSNLVTRPLAIWTESYGGHYGPTFAAYFLSQNDAIAAGTVQGKTLNLKYLGVGDGLTDPVNQYPGYIEYAANNPYHALTTSTRIASANTSWTKSGGCRDQIIACNNGGSNSVCSAAQSYCNNNILSPLSGSWDVYFILAKDPDPYPADMTSYLASIQSKIGAETTWHMTNDNVYSNFATTGDWMRTSAHHFETVINAGVRTHIYVGDADYILNVPGIEAMMAKFNTTFTTEFNAQNLTKYTVRGQDTGLYKNAGTLSYLRIYGAGHEVPAYTHGSLDYGEAAFQMFTQVMNNGPIVPT